MVNKRLRPRLPRGARQQGGTSTPRISPFASLTLMIVFLLGAASGISTPSGETLKASIFGGNAEEVRLAIRAGEDPNAMFGRQSALGLAATLDVDSTAIMRILLEEGAQVNMQDYEGKTALMHAAGASHKEDTIRFLIEHGADVELQGTLGTTALMMACHNTNSGYVDMLLSAGADPNTLDSDENTALTFASECKIASFLARHERLGISLTTDLTSSDVKTKCASMVRKLLSAGADATFQDKDGVTSLMWAAESGHTELAALLLDAGADVNAVNVKHGTTALSIAVIVDSEEMIEFLREAEDIARKKCANDEAKATCTSPRERNDFFSSTVVKITDVAGMGVFSTRSFEIGEAIEIPAAFTPQNSNYRMALMNSPFLPPWRLLLVEKIDDKARIAAWTRFEEESRSKANVIPIFDKLTGLTALRLEVVRDIALGDELVRSYSWEYLVLGRNELTRVINRPLPKSGGCFVQIEDLFPTGFSNNCQSVRNSAPKSTPVHHTDATLTSTHWLPRNKMWAKKKRLLDWLRMLERLIMLVTPSLSSEEQRRLNLMMRRFQTVNYALN